MCRWGLGLMLLGMAVATDAAEPEAGGWVDEFELLTIQAAPRVSEGVAQTIPYRLSIRLIPGHVPDTAHFGAAASGAARLLPGAKPERDVSAATTASQARFVDGERTPWLLLLRLETRGERLEFKPLRHSLWLQWTRTLQ